MKLTIDQIDKINDTMKFIIKWCPWFGEEDLIISEEKIKEIIEDGEEIEDLEFAFPGEDESYYIDIQTFLNLSDEIKSIKIIHEGLIRTNLRSYYIVSVSDSEHGYILEDILDINIKPSDGIEINLTNESLIIGLAATHLEEYDKDDWGTYSQYIVLEIIYNDKTKILPIDDELGLVQSFLFEFADSTGIALTLSEINRPFSDFDTLRCETEETMTKGLRGLETYNEGMKLFVSAIQIQDQELKFLNFYKVLEHIAPIAVNSEANELMRKKLDAPKSKFEDGDFIRSIFDLAIAMRDKFNDEDLIKATFNTCFDFIGLFEELPNTLKGQIQKHLNLKELSYKTEKQKITTACNMAGKVIYSTRNKVVHAKANFISTGNEVAYEEMYELNKFMKEACSQAIRWYSRQPKHLRFDPSTTKQTGQS
ncbi:MAG: hypothetical protein Q7T53_10065 [Deltaproteobacteria bacterium]|nr:hypothetical protein [Deltaproteobacteria bacterium]